MVITDGYYMIRRLVGQQVITIVLLVSIVACTAYADSDGAPVVVHNAIGADVAVVPVQLGTTEFSFVLDSGASHHVFDISLEPYLGTRLRTAIANDTTSVSLFKAPKMTVCGISLESESKAVATVNLAKVREALGQDIRGIIGIPFFANRVIRFNTDQRDVEIYPRSASSQYWGREIPLSIKQSGLALLDCGVAEQETAITCVVDTGMNSEIALAAGLFDSLRERNSLIVKTQSMSAGIAGEMRKENGRLTSFAIGPFKHRELIVSRSTTNAVGLGYLKRYIVTMDLTGRRLYLSESGRYNEVEQFDLSGLALSLIDDWIVVTSVESRSPGEVAGIVKGDAIVACDCRPVSGEMLSVLRRILKSNESREVVLTIRREDQVTQRSIRLREPPWRQQDR